MILTKKYRLLWNADLQITQNGNAYGEKDGVDIPSAQGGAELEFSFEADTQEELDTKIEELELTEIKE